MARKKARKKRESVGHARRGLHEETEARPDGKRQKKTVKTAKAKETVKRDFIIGNDLGYDFFSADLNDLAGDPKAIEEQAMQVKDQIIAICTRVGGKVVRCERFDDELYEQEDEEVIEAGQVKESAGFKT